MAKYALVIGLTDYRDFNQLTRPATDAQAVAQILQTSGYRITPVLETANYEDIVGQLKFFLQQTAHKNEALIYITGHSFLVQDDFTEESTGYIATSNCRVRREANTIVEQRLGIPFVNFNKLIAKSDLSNLVLLLDTCHSGGLIEQGLFQQSFSTFGQKTDYFFITAARSSESAWAKSGEKHSVFTTALLSGLAQKNAPEGGAITGDDLFAHIARQLQQEKQEPMRMGQGRSIEIVRYGAMAPAAQISEENPYQGLKAFDEDSQKFFFGREQEIELLLAKLGQTNFVPVIGVSGSGKSSVVRAGLIPALRQMGNWRILEPIKPGIEPMAMLKNAFCQLVSHSRDVNRMAERIGAKDLLGAVALLAETATLETEKILLVVDQFEEVFALGSSLEEKQQFIDCLTGIARVENSQLAIVTTMRADFLSDWLGYGELIESIQKDAVFLGRLQGQVLLDAVEKPAQVQGHSIENGLLQLIADDMKASSNALPLLEFALEALWDERDKQNHCLTVNAYTGMDRLKGTLNNQATKVYDRLAKNEQGWCRRICLSLIRIGKEGKDTRQRQIREKLLALGQTDSERELIDYVIDRLVGARLLVTGGDGQQRYVDIAHEALMEGWRQFADWRQEDRDLQRLGQRTRDAYEDWMGYGQHPDYLIPSGLLAELRELSGTVRNDVLLAMDLRSFFSRSDEQDHEQRAALKKALADAQIQNRSRKMRDQLINLPQCTVETTLEAIDTVGSSLTAFKDEVKHSAQYALNQTWYEIRERLKLKGHSNLVNAVAFSPQGDCIVSASDDATLRLWDREGNPIERPLRGHSDLVNAVAFSPDGEHIVSGSNDATLRLWDREGNPIGQAFQGHRKSVRAVAFSPEGDYIVSASADATLRLWDREGNPIGQPFQGHRGSVRAVAFSPEGDRIVSASRDGTLRLWDREGNLIRSPIHGHCDSVNAVAFSPEGNCIVSASADATLRLWDREGNPIGEPFRGHCDSVNAVAFSPEGNCIVSASADATLRLWDRKGNSIGSPLQGHSRWIYTVAFSPEGDHILSGGSDNTLRLWELNSNLISQSCRGHNHWVRAVAFSPKGDYIVSASRDRTLRLWDREGNPIGEPFRGHRDSVNAVTFSPQGDCIVSASDDATLQMWDREGHSIGNPLKGHRDSVNAVAFSPQGDCFLSGGSDNTLRLWDREGHSIGHPLKGHSRSVNAVAFSPQGDCILSGSADNTLRLWDREGNPIGEPFQGHSRSVNAVAFSPDGEHIVSGSNDNTL
ncbi:MAG: caspase family protein, partial [Cyanobacteria bacterium P01_B01_bin.77]